MNEWLLHLCETEILFYFIKCPVLLQEAALLKLLGCLYEEIDSVCASSFIGEILQFLLQADSRLKVLLLEAVILLLLGCSHMKIDSVLHYGKF